MKIVINTDQIYLHGGIEKVMATKVNWWAAQPGTEVFIVTTEQQHRPPCYQLDPMIQLIDLGVNYDRSKSYFSLRNIRKAFTHFRSQKKILNKLEPDIIISPNMNFDHYWLPLIKGQAKVLKERHGSRYFESQGNKSSLLNSLKLTFNKYIDSKYDRIVVLNPDEKKYVSAQNAAVIPNPVEPTSLSADVSQKVVMAAGRISPVKGFDHLISIWSMVAENFPDWQLHLYGQDYLGTQNKLEAQLKSLGLDMSVFFKGSVPDIHIPMAGAGIYAMTSITECFPMVLLEALAVGLPVISWDAPTGPRHILAHGSDSCLVPYRNYAIFADRLKQLMNDQGLRMKMSTEAKRNVERFEILKVMTQWKALFDELRIN
ncbi:glycosyltransferase family 4 protein [Chryseobacterium sp. H3056]|uniref:Glycosyltransferase family 4 protein n=1 Tax=Kaistella daneshvariae TaxID=2487074 RepID=A0A3N0WVX6_9FLAO|nr:glycosyltransferase [Kaistella daneshvariae]ROI09222.1 glycosyltransferase family 4 protein [Kaistella daneshvariae]